MRSMILGICDYCFLRLGLYPGDLIGHVMTCFRGLLMVNEVRYQSRVAFEEFLSYHRSIVSLFIFEVSYHISS